MQDGIRGGILKPMDPRMMAAALTGIVNSNASRWLTVAEGTSLMDNVRFVVDIFLQGVGKMRIKHSFLWRAFVSCCCHAPAGCPCGGDVSPDACRRASIWR